MTEELKNNKGIVLPLFVDGFILLLGAYQLGKINTTLEALGQKIAPISEAKIAVLQQSVDINEKRIDQLELAGKIQNQTMSDWMTRNSRAK